MVHGYTAMLKAALSTPLTDSAPLATLGKVHRRDTAATPDLAVAVDLYSFQLLRLAESSESFLCLCLPSGN